MAETSTSELRPVIHRLFKGLQLTYPNFCRGLDKKHTDATKRLWAENLKNYSDDRILHGLYVCPQHYPSKPVTVGEFRKLCASRPEHREAPPLRLEMLKSSTAVGREAIDKMRSMLGKSTRVQAEAKAKDEQAIIARKKVLAEQAAQYIRDHPG